MIRTLKHLTYTLKTELATINDILADVDSYYISWSKVKTDKDTGLPLTDADGNQRTRQLNSTKIELKRIQKRILALLMSHVEIPTYAFGGVPKKDNIKNAKYHQGNKYIFTTDLRSFFPSISHNSVFEVYCNNGYSPTVARILTKLTTYKYQLPQGVPTSTLLALLAFKPTGDKLYDYALQHNLKFSIFVDDITISSNVDFKHLVPEILDIIVTAGYKISHNKTHYSTKNPIITGIKCQNNRIKLPQSTYKRISKLPKDSNSYKGLIMYRKRIDSNRE
ncbi:MAG: RNA-directed DNA polymerase [Alphaproteobacteria bacterium]|nr:RNA-directed DNA polymerase [Alphaproteobacteria bacterium]